MFVTCITWCKAKQNQSTAYFPRSYVWTQTPAEQKGRKADSVILAVSYHQGNLLGDANLMLFLDSLSTINSTHLHFTSGISAKGSRRPPLGHVWNARALQLKAHVHTYHTHTCKCVGEHLPVDHDEAKSWLPPSALTCIHSPNVKLNWAGKGERTEPLSTNLLCMFYAYTHSDYTLHLLRFLCWSLEGEHGVLLWRSSWPSTKNTTPVEGGWQGPHTAEEQDTTTWGRLPLPNPLRAGGGERERIKPTFPLQQQLLHKAPLDSTFWGLDQIPESAQSIWKHLGSTGFACRNRRHLLSRTE